MKNKKKNSIQNQGTAINEVFIVKKLELGGWVNILLVVTHIDWILQTNWTKKEEYYIILL